MKDYIDFAILGLGAGALYAALSIGVVLTYKGSGVINFSHGAIAMYIAYIYAGLKQGRLMIPPLPNPLVVIEWIANAFGADVHMPRLATFVSLGGPLKTPFAFVASMLIAALLGLLLHYAVFRPLRDAPPLAKTVASVGVLLVLQAIVVLRFGTDGQSIPTILPGNVVKVGGASLPMDRLILLIIAVGATIVLMASLRLTRIGKALRAASENETGATLIGLNANRLAATTWVASCLLAGGVGILYGSMSGINPTTMVLFIVPALGAALVGRVNSFAIAAVVAIAIGMIGSMTQLAQTKFSWFPQVGAAEGISVIVIVLAVVLRGRTLPSRGTATKVRLPAAPEPGRRVGPLAVAAVVITVMALFLPYDFRAGLVNSLIFVVIALSLVVATGFAGQLSLFQMGMAGFTALMVVRWSHALGIGFPLDGILALATAAVVGVIMGLPSLRVRGIELAILTLALGYAFEAMVLNNSDWLKPEYGNVGAVRSPKIFGWDFGINARSPLSFGQHAAPNPMFVLFVMIVTLLCCAAVLGLRRSDLGRRFLAVRGDERAAAGLGINVGRTKLLAFSLSGVLAGVGGVLTAYQFESVTSSSYVALNSITILAFAYLGGIGTVGGAAWTGTLAVGGIGYVVMDRLADLGQLLPLVGGLGLILTAILNPEGIAGVMAVSVGNLRKRLSRRPPQRTSDPQPLEPGADAAKEPPVGVTSDV